MESIDHQMETNYQETAADVGTVDLSAFDVPEQAGGGSGGGSGNSGGGNESSDPNDYTREDESDGYENLALNKPASSSSVGWGGVASRGNDGDTSGVYGDGSTFHTYNGEVGWWEVDLEESRSIVEINLWNRTDSCCVSRASDLVIYVDGVAVITSPGVPGTPSVVTLPPGTTGQVIRVENGNMNHFHLAEVEVLGE